MCIISSRNVVTDDDDEHPLVLLLYCFGVSLVRYARLRLDPGLRHYVEGPGADVGKRTAVGADVNRRMFVVKHEFRLF